MAELLIPVLLLAVVIAVVAVPRAEDEAATVLLTFPRTVTKDQAIAAARSLAGLLPPWWHFTPAPSVTLEARATAAGIRHRLAVPASRAEYVIGSLRAAIPGLRVVEESAASDPSPTLARELAASRDGELRTDTTASTNTGLLASLQPLAGNERAVLQYVITPTSSHPFTRTLARWFGRAPDPKELPVEPQFAVAIRAGVTAPSAPRSRQLISRLLGAFHALNGPEARLVRRLLPSQVVADRMEGRAPGRSVIGADELAAAWAVPVEAPELPGLTLAHSRELQPEPSVPRRGLVLGDSTVAGASRPVAVTQAEARRGVLCLAPTGSGKSTVLTNFAVQLMNAKGRPGLVAIDSKGDLIADLADRIPVERRKDTIIFDPADRTAVAGFNLIGGSGESDLIVDTLVAELRHRYGAAGLGPRSEDLLRAALTTLTAHPGRFALTEVEPVLTNPAFRQGLIGSLEEPVLAGFWSWYASLSPAAQAEMVAPLANKLRSFTLRRRVRAVIGQTEGLDLGAALEGGKIVLVSLSKGLLGQDAAALIGAAMVSRLWAAIQARAAVPASERRPATIICDEFQDLAKLSPVFGEAVAQSRGYKVGWVLAHQHLGQLDPATREAVLANLRTRLVLQTTARDAAAFAREFAPYLTAADLQGLGAFEGYAAVSTGSAVAAPASIRTRPAPDPVGSTEAVRNASRKRYGMSPADVDAAIRKRIAGSRRPAPIGERRRES
ncbi:MAG: type IV secretory system conjugative DNA transfer family protein [Solirubrobacterales bacterium]